MNKFIQKYKSGVTVFQAYKFLFLSKINHILYNSKNVSINLRKYKHRVII